MREELIEEVARAFAEMTCPTEEGVAEWQDNNWRRYWPESTVALDAILDKLSHPSTEMLHAGSAESIEDDPEGIFTAMIATLREK